MAKKKLNKKVAIIGTIFLAAFVLGAIWVLLRMTQGPEKFLNDGDIAYKAQDYEKAAKLYSRAVGRSKTNDLTKKILFKMADTYEKQEDWAKVLGCFKRISIIDTTDVPSREKLLAFSYEMADSGQGSVWKNVLTTVEELNKIKPSAKNYMIHGRAIYELAKRGEISDRERAIADSTAALTKAKELNPKDPQPYWFLAQTSILKGELMSAKGLASEKDKSYVQAQTLLKQAIKAAPNDPNGYVNLLGIRLKELMEKNKPTGPVEADFAELVKKFPNSAMVHSALSGYYKLDPNDINKALAEAQKAYQFDKGNIAYAINIAELSYYKGALTKDAKFKNAAVEVAKTALNMPQAKLTKGSREWINKMNRLSLNTFLANCYISELMDMPTDTPKAKKEEIISSAEQVVHDISQIWGTGDQPYVVQIEGMLEFAKGDKIESVRKMYAAYQQLKASDPQNQDVQLGQLSYALARAFESSPETGARQEFLYNALTRGIFRSRPEALVEYALVTLQLRAYDGALNALTMYEKMLKPTPMSTALRAKAYIGSGQVDEADSLISKLNTSDPNYIAIKFAILQSRVDHAVASSIDKTNKEEIAAIQGEIKKYTDTQAKLAEQFIKIDPNASQAIGNVTERLISQARIEDAKAFIAKILAARPENSTALTYKVILAEKDPAKITSQRRIEIAEQSAKLNPNKLSRALTLADIYRTQQQHEKALEQYKEALSILPSDRNIISLLFETAISAKDMKTAEQAAGIAKRENIDFVQGLTFAARLSMVDKNYKDALDKLDAAIKTCPLSASAFLLRSSVYASMEEQSKALEDAQKASTLNPLDSVSAKQVASLFYQRNLKLGKSVTEEQQNEARMALERAFALNPREWQLLSFYAEYISDKTPEKALSIRQRLQKIIPTVENANLLGNLALRMADDVSDQQVKKAYMQIAGDAYQQGYQIDPKNADLLFNYARFLRLSDQPEKAAKLLSGSNDKNLMWKYYISSGQSEKARQILNDLYKADSKNVTVIKGLLLLSQNAGDADGIVKYSQELITYENTPENAIIQIKSYLDAGLIQQAEKLLAAFCEKNPKNTAGMLLEALLHSRKGEFKEALDSVNKSLAVNQNDYASWNLRGQIYMALGKNDEAVSDFQKAKSINPNSRTRMDLARAYLRARRGDDAINELKVAIQEDENAQDARQMLEAVYSQLNRKDALTAFYSDTIKKFPDNLFWYRQAGNYSLSQKNTSNAISIFKSAWQIASKLASQNQAQPQYVKQGMAMLDGYLQSLITNKQYSDVVSYAAQYVDSAYSPIAYARMADAKMKLGDKSTSLDLYRKALDKAEKDDSLLLEILGRMADVVGRNETIAWCGQQLKTSPDSVSLNYAMCNLMQLTTEYNKAIAYVDKCMELVGPKSPAYRNFNDNKQAILVKAYEKTQDKQYLNSAIKLYEKVINDATLPETGALNNLAYLLADQNIDLTKASDYARKAYETAPTNPNILDTYAFVLYKKGEFAKAAEFIHNSISMFEQSSVSAPAETYQHAGMINEKLNRKPQALAAYKQALEIGDQSLSDKNKEQIKSSIQRLSK